MIEDYDKEAGHGSFSEERDFVEMLERYYKPNGYKDELAKKQILQRYMRQMVD